MITREEGGDDVRSVISLTPWATNTCYNGQYNGQPSRKTEQIPSKLVSVRIEGLKLDLLEAGIASNRVGQNTDAVNTFPGLVHTARHTTKVR